MGDEIGQGAGQVWGFLDVHGESSTLQIRSSLKMTQTLLFLSLGWLAREGKISILYRDRCYWVSLRR
ncbi:MAG: winged helix-turn-helix domain-containing protein [Elusimicrobia bacterium]|nr:winged helix-turn-helix domain-containing protein [Elusimicrobiota bacterium]